MKTFRSLPLFLLLVMGGGIVIGTLTAPGDWYASLAKPVFNPPNWIFAPVWTALYLAIAIAGWRTWQRGAGTTSMRLWSLQLGLNFLWSPIFFTAHRTDLALVVVLALLLTILAFIRSTWRLDRLSALLFVPYALWVAFASMLNAAILLLNPSA